jgi:hypothetical protein
LGVEWVGVGIVFAAGALFLGLPAGAIGFAWRDRISRARRPLNLAEGEWRNVEIVVLQRSEMARTSLAEAEERDIDALLSLLGIPLDDMRRRAVIKTFRDGIIYVASHLGDPSLHAC